MTNRLRTGQADGESRTAPEFALHRHLTAHLFDGVPDDGEAEAGAAGLAGTRLIGTVETLKDSWKILRCDTDTRVGDGYDRPAILDDSFQAYFTIGAIELDGVVQQIGERLLQAKLMAEHLNIRQIAPEQAHSLQTRAG